MGALFDAVLALGALGFKRGASREPDPVPANGWLLGAAVVLALFTAVALVAAGVVVAAAFRMMNDWMFMFLGLILLPIVLAGGGAVLAMAAWTVPVSIRLARGDAAMRPDLAASGALALAAGFLVTGIPTAYGLAPGLLVCAAGAYLVGVACWPLPWTAR